MFCEPLSGWRQVTVRERRTKVDWAKEVAELLRTRYASAEKVLLVCDNLNTHTKGAFYEAFDAATARAILRRLQFRYTPKHGSWLNIAEIELSVLSRQCLDRRVPDFATLQAEVAAWVAERNQQHVRIAWRFGIDDARVKLAHCYPAPEPDIPTMSEYSG